MNIDVLERIVGWMNKTLSTAYERACLLPGISKKQNPPWWDKDIAGRLKRLDKTKRQTKANWQDLQLNGKYMKRQIYAIRSGKKKDWTERSRRILEWASIDYGYQQKKRQRTKPGRSLGKKWWTYFLMDSEEVRTEAKIDWRKSVTHDCQLCWR